MLESAPVQRLTEALKARDDIKFSILFGSRARNTAQETSDWDVALFFKDNSDAWESLGKKEEIRNIIAKTLEINSSNIDIVDLKQGDLSINATVVDEGIVLSEQDSLSLAYYYQGVWSKIENFYWITSHAA